jgi:CRP-like cAMP-binding protein
LPAAQNLLIQRLPGADRKRLLAVCEPVELVLADVVCEAGAQIREVYFPVDGFVSLLTQIDAHPSLEVGMVGREGMLGVQLALGVTTSPARGLVQGGGSAWRVGAAPFRRTLGDSAALQRMLDRYVCVQMEQLASAAACLRFHTIGQRLARWLLMSQDRAHSPSFHVTHEFLAYMLGVRRVGITVAAGSLQRQKLIEYHRGELTVLDRPGLEAAACTCYAHDCRTYADLMH